MRNLAFVPEALLTVTAVVVLLVGRRAPGEAGRRVLPAAVVAVVLIALGLELSAGSTLSSYLGGALAQDRFALFAKTAVLLALATGLASTDWSGEDSISTGLSMPLLAAAGVMVVASASDLVGLWAGLELAGAASAVLVASRRHELGLKLILVGAVASALILLGLAFLYATTGSPALDGMHAALRATVPALPLAIPLALLFAGLAVRAGAAPLLAAVEPAAESASPLGAGLISGLVAAAAIAMGLKVVAATIPIAQSYGPFLEVVAAAAMFGGGAAALAARSVRLRVVYLCAGQVGWILAGLATHYRTGLGASLFLLGAFAVAATCAPTLAGKPEVSDASVAGLSVIRPARAAGLALAMLSLAGAPPLAGFFGELAVGAALAQGGHFVVLVIGLAGVVLATAAAIQTVGSMYLQVPPEDSRRTAGTAVPAATALGSAGAVALVLLLAAYGVAGYPIYGLADQGAKALGLR